MTDSSAVGVDQDAEQLKALGYVSHFDRTMSKWENFSSGIYLSLAGGRRVHHFRQRFHRRWAADVVDLHPGRPGPAPGVLGVRRDRLAVSDLGRLVSLGATPHRQALGMDGRLGLCLGPVLHHGGRRHRRGAVSRATIRRRQTPTSRPPSSCAHRHDHFFEPERDPPAGPGGDVRLHLRIGGGHRGRRLPTIVRSASAAQVLLDTSLVPTQQLPAFLASSLAAMFCYYGFEACGDVAEETPNASRMIPKAMRMTIYIGGAAATWVCLAFVLSIPDIGAVMSGKDKDPIVTLLARPWARRFSRRHRGGAGVLHLLPVELAGRGQPLDIRVRARSDDFRQQVLEPHVARPPCSCHGADRDGRDSGGDRALGACGCRMRSPLSSVSRRLEFTSRSK